MKSKPIRIAFDASPLIANKTGIAYYIERTISHLAAQYPDEIELIGFYYNFLGRRPTTNMPSAPNISYHEVKFIPSKLIYQLRRWYIEYPLEFLVGKRVDFAFFANFLSYPSLFHTPNAPVIHDLTYIDLPQYVSAKLRSDLTRFVPVAIRRSSFIVSVSDFTKQRIHDFYHEPLDTIITTPIPPAPSVQYTAVECKDTLVKLGITKPYIVTLGTIEPRKNVINLIEAYKQMSKKQRDVYSLVIAGRIGWYSEDTETAIKEAARNGYDVIHLGYVSDTDREILYQSATLFVSASHYEGFGMPVLEAMNYGIPCVISDIPVYREVAGDNARYFNQESPASIAKEISVLLADTSEMNRLRLASKKQVATYSWSAIATVLHDKIKQVLKK